MCGRIVQKTPCHLIVQNFGMDGEYVPNLPPRYNIPPGGSILAIRSNSSGERVAVPLRWGLIPSWARDEKIGWKLTNARAETLFERPAYRDAVRKRRCLIPVDGFYEWQTTDEGKNPFLFRASDERPFVIAGLWESWNSPSGDSIESCTLITTAANDLIRRVHDRMPVIVPREKIDLWLDQGVPDAGALVPMLIPLPSEQLMATPVSRSVNNPRYDDPGCFIAA